MDKSAGSVTLSSANAFNSVTLQSGRITAGHANALGTGTVNIGANTLDLDFSGTLNSGNTISGNGTINIRNDVEIAHANAFGGTTNVGAGKTLTLGHANALQNSGLDVSGTLKTKQASTVGSLTAHSGSVVDPTGTLNIGATATFNGVTLKIDTTTSDLIAVGDATFIGTNTVDLETALAGSYTFLTATGAIDGFNANAMQTKYRGGDLNNRQSASYTNTGDALALTITSPRLR